MGKATILWVQDKFDGPTNGLVSYENENLWFCKDGDGDSYKLYRLTEEVSKIVEDEHTRYCEHTGAPLKHGDPTKIKRKGAVNKVSATEFAKPGDDFAEGQARCLGKVTEFRYNFNFMDVTG